MKKIFFMLIVTASFLYTSSVFGEESYTMSSSEKERAYGFKMMMGGRYDDMRMCVASPAGTIETTVFLHLDRWCLTIMPLI